MDSFLCFTDINIGWPGRVHDAKVFSNSCLFGKAQVHGSPFPDGPVNISGIQVPALLLGDPGYPLLHWLM